MRSRVADALGKGVGRSQARPGCRPASTAHCVSNDTSVRGGAGIRVLLPHIVSQRSQFLIPLVALWMACVRHPCAIARQKSERSDVFVCAASCMIHGVPRGGISCMHVYTATPHGQFSISRFVHSIYVCVRHVFARSKYSIGRNDHGSAGDHILHIILR